MLIPADVSPNVLHPFLIVLIRFPGTQTSQPVRCGCKLLSASLLSVISLDIFSDKSAAAAALFILTFSSCLPEKDLWPR